MLSPLLDPPLTLLISTKYVTYKIVKKRHICMKNSCHFLVCTNFWGFFYLSILLMIKCVRKVASTLLILYFSLSHTDKRLTHFNILILLILFRKLNRSGKRPAGIVLRNGTLNHCKLFFSKTGHKVVKNKVIGAIPFSFHSRNQCWEWSIAELAHFPVH